MNIVTIMNYATASKLDSIGVQNGVNMCKIWIYLVKRSNPDANILILEGDNNSKEISEFASNYDNIKFSKLEGNVLKRSETKGRPHVAQELFFKMWLNEDVKKLEKRFFVEADAFIIKPLDDWWDIIDEKPFMVVDEVYYGESIPTFNSGVYSYSGNDFITYDKLIKQYEKDGAILCQAGEQGLLNAYLRSINYDYGHDNVDHRYNYPLMNLKLKSVNDDAIEICTGNRNKTEFEGWMKDVCAWDYKGDISILHGVGYKPWNVKESLVLWNYCLDKIKEIENV